MTSDAQRRTPTPVPRITAAHDKDAEALARLHATSLPAPWTADESALFVRQQGVRAWAADDGRTKTLQGFILVRHVDEEAEIMTIAVDPAARRHGIGRALLSHAMEELRNLGVAALHLEVATNNAAALSLYRTLGFVPSGKRRNYYKGTENATSVDAALMRCDL